MRVEHRARLRAPGVILVLLVTVALLLAACQPVQPAADTAAQAPAAEAEASAADALPAVIDYNLGDSILVNPQFAEESRFRNMPVRLNGVIALPEGDGPAPVVLILHGTHPGCPETQHMVDEWPCDPAVEQRNYAGWGWLAQRLAAAGYIALAPNINAEFTFGFGEAAPGERLLQLVDQHLGALAAAGAGAADAPDFGVALAGRVDLTQLLLIGHSRGAGEAWRLLRERGLEGEPPAGQPYGPARGLLAVAPAPTVLDDDPLAIPLAILLPACDGDVIQQDGQTFYEKLRLAEGQAQWVTSLWLEGANHNQFNTVLGPDMMVGAQISPACSTMLDGDAQRAFLGALAVDFAAAVLGSGPAATAAQAALGLDFAQPLAAEHYGQPTRTALLAPAAQSLRLLTPAGDSELTTHLQGGAVSADGVQLHFCTPGFSTPMMEPGSEPCRRPNFTIPGNPAMAVLSWEQPGALLRFALPAGADFSAYGALSLRVAVDPLAANNAPGASQALSLRLTDAAGATATVPAPAAAELAFPQGEVRADDFFGSLFTSVVPLTTLRVPLAAFAGVDLATVTEVALVLDATPSGTLFLADVELVAPAE